MARDRYVQIPYRRRRRRRRRHAVAVPGFGPPAAATLCTNVYASRICNHTHTLTINLSPPTPLRSDNGPEKNCAPEGRCDTDHYRNNGPGVADPLRGRKRDIWEGGHRIPSVISWPKVVQGSKGRVSWETVATTDFLPTIMDVLNVSRPAGQVDWGLDGRSILPLLTSPVSAFEKQTQTVYADKLNVMPAHPVGWMFNGWDANAATTDKGFRYGQWKLVHSSKSCGSQDCKAPMLFDLAADLGEAMDVSSKYPEVFAAIQSNFTSWYGSVLRSIVNESQCNHIGPARPPTPAPPVPPTPPVPPSTSCEFHADMALSDTGHSKLIRYDNVTSPEACCGYCLSNPACAGAAYHPNHTGAGHCVLRSGPLQEKEKAGATVCVAKR